MLRTGKDPFQLETSAYIGAKFSVVSRNRLNCNDKLFFSPYQLKKTYAKMKHSRIPVLLIGLFAIAAFSFTTLTVEKLTIDTEASVINWHAEKVTGTHDGTLRLKSGELEMENGVLTAGNFTIDMSTLTVTDLEGKGKERLEGHLKSPDFFSVEEFKEAMFTITKVVPRGKPGDYRITGDVTIKGHTKEIRFNAIMEDSGETAKTATAEIILDRTDFDIRYGSGAFFDNLGDKTIYDEFKLTVNLVIKK